MLRCFNPYVYDGYHASPLITVLSDFPHPDLDAFPDDASIKPIVLASSDLVKLEDWWWPSKLILVACPPVQAFSAQTHHLLYGCGPSGVPVPAPALGHNGQTSKKWFADGKVGVDRATFNIISTNNGKTMDIISSEGCKIVLTVPDFGVDNDERVDIDEKNIFCVLADGHYLRCSGYMQSADHIRIDAHIKIQNTHAWFWVELNRYT